MKFSLVAIVVALSVVAIVGGGQPAGAYVIPPTEPERHMTKRSLCNTFGGCGAKRSMQQLVYNNGRQYDTSDGGVVTITDGKNPEPWSVKRRESKLELISEILNDLIEYLKTSEKYRQGKYIVMVSKPTGDSAQASGGLQLNALDVQELQQTASRNPYINKDVE